ncbi:MAG: L-threonylcarbamoyladenylate synthase [Patescibacteria group bacterium]
MSLSLVSVLRQGGIAVIRTDTLLGIVARSFDRRAVRRLYALRRKTPKKPFIILISSVEELAAFGVKPNAAQLGFLKKVWPGKVSVILSVPPKKFRYLHRGTNSLAFRVPKLRSLRALLARTGPLVAPSANLEGEKPAETLVEAKRYFGKRVTLYVGARRRVRGKPSALVSLLGARPKVLRRNEVRLQV